jgi:hypothetical protein
MTHNDPSHNQGCGCWLRRKADRQETPPQCGQNLNIENVLLIYDHLNSGGHCYL